MNNPIRQSADTFFKEGYLIGGIIAIVSVLPFLGMGLLITVISIIVGDGDGIVSGLVFVLGALCFIAVGITFLLSYRSKNKVKKSSIYLDGVIISYEIDYKTRSHGLGGPPNRLICRCHFTDGSYRDFVSDPTWSDPNYYMGKVVRVYSNSPDFLYYLVDLDTAK